jgi:hypothetical protein
MMTVTIAYDWLGMVERIQREIAIKLKEEGVAAAGEEIEKACSRLCGVPFALIRHYPSETLLELMRRGANAEERCLVLAELLMQYAELCQGEGRIADAAGGNLQAHGLISASLGILKPEQQAAYRDKLKVLVEKLAPFADDPYVRRQLVAATQS